MLRWNNDYHHGAHPEILKALAEINDNHFGGYGFDEWCDAAKSEICSHFGAYADQAEIHFLSGGTQANLTVITAALRPVESVICVDAGHINCHEAGSIEATGHKMLALKSEDGKVHADALEAEAGRFYCDETPGTPDPSKDGLYFFPYRMGHTVQQSRTAGTPRRM